MSQYESVTYNDIQNKPKIIHTYDLKRMLNLKTKIQRVRRVKFVPAEDSLESKISSQINIIYFRDAMIKYKDPEQKNTV